MASLPTFIKVLVVQEPKSGTTKNGKPFQLQEVDCITMDENGVEQQVGVLSVPRELIGNIQRGIYTPVYAMRVDFQTRKIGPSIVDLTPYKAPGKVADQPKA